MELKKHIIIVLFFFWLSVFPLTPLAIFVQKRNEKRYIYLAFHLGYEPTLIEQLASIFVKCMIACLTIMSSISHMGQNFSH